MTLRGLLVSSAALVLIGTACEYDPAQFAGSPVFSECAGEPATIGIGWYEPHDGSSGSTYYGTEGDDVVVITNGPVTFYGLGGDDLICINDTGMAWGTGGWLVIDAGAGSDTVHNTASVTLSEGGTVGVLLGSGDDTFQGGPATEWVDGGSGADQIFTGAGNDVIFDAGTPEGDYCDCGEGDNDVVDGDFDDADVVNCEWDCAFCSYLP